MLKDVVNRIKTEIDNEKKNRFVFIIFINNNKLINQRDNRGDHFGIIRRHM